MAKLLGFIIVLAILGRSSAQIDILINCRTSDGHICSDRGRCEVKPGTTGYSCKCPMNRFEADGRGSWLIEEPGSTPTCEQSVYQQWWTLSIVWAFLLPELGYSAVLLGAVLALYRLHKGAGLKLNLACASCACIVLHAVLVMAAIPQRVFDASPNEFEISAGASVERFLFTYVNNVPLLAAFSMVYLFWRSLTRRTLQASRVFLGRTANRTFIFAVVFFLVFSFVSAVFHDIWLLAYGALYLTFMMTFSIVFLVSGIKVARTLNAVNPVTHLPHAPQPYSVTDRDKPDRVPVPVPGPVPVPVAAPVVHLSRFSSGHGSPGTQPLAQGQQGQQGQGQQGQQGQVQVNAQLAPVPVPAAALAWLPDTPDTPNTPTRLGADPKPTAGRSGAKSGAGSEHAPTLAFTRTRAQSQRMSQAQSRAHSQRMQVVRKVNMLSIGGSLVSVGQLFVWIWVSWTFTEPRPQPFLYILLSGTSHMLAILWCAVMLVVFFPAKVKAGGTQTVGGSPQAQA